MGVLDGASVSIVANPLFGRGVQVVAIRTGVFVAEGRTSSAGMVGGGKGFKLE